MPASVRAFFCEKSQKSHKEQAARPLIDIIEIYKPARTVTLYKKTN